MTHPASDPRRFRILETVQRTVRKFGMIHPGEAVLAGLSGGPDSVALVAVLSELSAPWDLRIGAVHVHHGLRGYQADLDAEYSEKVARSLGLPFYLHRADVATHARSRGLSLEEAGRQIRYAAFSETARNHGYTRIAVGHHAEDNAEAMLMFMLRGSGRIGIAGIAPVRPDGVVRPLYDLTRRDIAAYLSARGLAHRTDGSNADTRFVRNRIRLKLLPFIEKEFGPGAGLRLHTLSRILADEETWIETLVEHAHAELKTAGSSGEQRLDIGRLRNLPTALQRRVVRMAVRCVKGDLRRIGFSHVEQALELMEGSRPRSLDFPDRILIRICGAELVVARCDRPPHRRPPGSGAAGFCRILTGPGELDLPEIASKMVFLEVPPDRVGRLPSDPGRFVAYLDMDAVRFPLLVRSLQPGDRFHPLGAGGTQKVAKFFSDHKISWQERARTPLVLSDDRIIWVAGHRIDEGVKIRPATRRVMRAEWLLA